MSMHAYRDRIMCKGSTDQAKACHLRLIRPISALPFDVIALIVPSNVGQRLKVND
jgi:hypothetical protein